MIGETGPGGRGEDQTEDEADSPDTDMDLPAERRWPAEAFERMGEEFTDMVNLREYVLAAAEPVLYSPVIA